MTIGYVHFDRSGMRNERTEILVSKEKLPKLVRNKYVRISNPGPDGVVFLGRIVEGPFFAPEEVSRDSALAQTAILKGESFPSVPEFYAVGGIEILGELRGERVFGVNTRPAPQAEVTELGAEDVKRLLSISGDMLVGNLDGYPDVLVHLRSDDKKVLPRNVGIFGTVGSGKTNTAQVLIEESCRSGYAVVVVDVEGEYVEMDQSSVELHDRLVEFQRQPRGVADFRVYYPIAGESERRGATPFTLRCADLEPLVLSEVIEAEEAQERRLLGILDELSKKSEREKKDAPAASLASIIAPETAREVPYTLQDVIGATAEKAHGAKGADQYSYFALLGKLGRLNRTKAFDVKACEPIDAHDLLVSGRVSVFDVSYCPDNLKNLVIADLLRKIFDHKLSSADAPKTLLVIEEAHTFISREKRSKMQETIEMLREITRRGRKRWLGLCFVSQQPSHLPPEIFELCNTRVVHNVKSQANIGALKNTAGDVSEEMWGNVPSLGAGQAVLSCPQLRDPVVINVRPSESKRKFVE
jgi:DNA helicase HerA-like ATPase